MTRVLRVTGDKWAYLQLLLEADPDRDMIARYLERGSMYVLEDDGEAVAVAVTVPLEDGCCELKNIAVDPTRQRRGYGAKLLEAVFELEKADYAQMLVGTTMPTAGFYKSLGFVYSHTLENFFLDNYPEPIFEGDVQCIDMVYFCRPLL